MPHGLVVILARFSRSCLLALAVAVVAASAVAFAAELGKRPTAGRATPACGHQRATIVGTSGPDRLIGTRRRDVIWAGAGDDLVRGRGGDDLVCAKGGDDRVFAGSGRDVVDGGKGQRDVLRGGAGDDKLAGRGGSDLIVGGGGNDRLSGRSGDDVLRGNAGDDRLGGGPGRDRCFGGPGTNIIRLCEEGDPNTPPPTDAAPVAVSDSATVVEDGGPTAIAVLANDTDADGGPRSIASATQPANGSVQVTGGGTGLMYEPKPNYCNDPAGSGTDDFSYTLAPGGSSAAVAVRVGCVNDAPMVSASAGSQAYTEGAAASAVDGGLTVADLDDASLAGARVRLSAGFQAGDELTFSDQGGITGTYDAGTGVLTLTGAASVAAYQTALRSVGYRHTGDAPAAAKTVEYRADDGDGLGPPATRAITVTGVNDAPVLDTSDAALTYMEGDGAVAVDAAIEVSDPDSAQLAGATVDIGSGFLAAEDELAFIDQLGITGSYNDATGAVTLTGVATVTSYATVLRSVTYQNSSSSPSPVTRTVSFHVTDIGALASNVATRDITIPAAPNAPVVTTTAGALAYTEGDPATVIDGALTVSDPDDTNLEGARVRISAGFEPADELLFTIQNGISGAYDAGTGVLTLTGTSSVANYQTALRSVQYRHTGDDPATLKTVAFSANDGDNFGAEATRDIDVTPVDDSPIAVDDGATVAEDSDASAIGVLANDTDVDGGPMAVASASDPANGIVVITGGGAGLTYEPDPNYCNDPPGTSPDTFTYTLNGGSTATVSVAVTCVDDTPIAVDDSATVAEDAGASAIDVLANDDNDDGGPMTISSASDPANGAVVLTGGLAGAHTGLTYQPDPNYCNDPPGTTPDTFTYTLNGGSTATVSVEVTCADDPPTAVDDSATVAEDSSASAIDVLANDTNSDGGPKVIASASDPANGTVVLTGGSPGARTGLTYEPDPNYCNDPPGASPDTFTYTLNGGSTATVSVAVTCVDDTPIAVDDSATVAEDAGASAIDVLANDDNDDGGPMTISSASDPANGAVVLTGGSPGAHTGLTYQPDPNYCNDPPGTTPDTFTYTLNGGSTATVSVKVTCPDAPPVAVADSATVAEDAAATAIDVLANDTNPDGGPIVIASASDPANGTVVLTGGSPGRAHGPDLRAGSELLQRSARGVAGHVHLHAQRRLDRDGLGHRELRRRHPDRRRRHRRCGRGRGRDRDRRAGQRHRRRRRGEDDLVGLRPGERDGGADGRAAGYGADLPAGCELLQQPARVVAGHVHLHAQRRLHGDRFGDGQLCARQPGRRHVGR